MNTCYDKGIEISYCDGNEEISWQSIRDACVNHVFFKISEGVKCQDSLFVKHWADARNAGFELGAWHDFTFSAGDIRTQLRNIVAALKATKFNPGLDKLALRLNITGTEGIRSSVVLEAFHTLLEWVCLNGLHGKKPYICCSTDVWEGLGGWQDYDFHDFPLWLLDQNETRLTLPIPWKVNNKMWTIRQYRQTCQIEGIEAPVALNYVYRDRPSY
ncbi:glycoside hydrolase family 25 protein [Pantoea cypripedii]|uniref:glycoside hydrolase family 25 protein n=1 Tax=Pantoea cypripedii TaxID=55209 RepID=UPI002FC9B968